MADNASQFTPEQLSSAELSLQAEINKVKTQISNINTKIEELKPKGLAGVFKSNKDEIEMLKEELSIAEDRLAELEAMTATDYLLHTKKQNSKGNIVDSGLLEMAAEALIPGAGSTVGKIAGSLLKTVIKKTLKE